MPNPLKPSATMTFGLTITADVSRHKDFVGASFCLQHEVERLVNLLVKYEHSSALNVILGKKDNQKEEANG
jgi:hypothetical protein